MAQKTPRSIGQLLQDPVKPNDDWIRGLLPRSAKVVYAGEAKVGKSFIGLEILRSLVTQEPTFGCPDFDVRWRTTALILEKELGEDEFKRRCHWTFYGLDPASIGESAMYMSGIPDVKLDIKDKLTNLIMLLDKLKPNVLILDPAAKFLAGDDSSNQDMAVFFGALDTLVDRYRDVGMSIILAHHYSKPAKTPDGKMAADRLNPYAMRGASRWYDDPDVVCSLWRDRDNPDDSEGIFFHTNIRFESRRSRMPADKTLLIWPEQTHRPIVSISEGEPAKHRGFDASPPRKGKKLGL